MRLVYLILAHQLPDQVVRLVRALAEPESSFLIHWDRRSPDGDLSSILRELSGLADIRPLPRAACRWGGFSIVEATLAGVRAACADERSFDYIVLLSGQDYPIKPPVALRALFRAAEGESFLVHRPFPISVWQGGGWDRFQRWHYPPGRFNRVLEFAANRLGGRRALPHNLQPFGGSQFWALGRDAAGYVVEFTARNPDVERFFERVYVPDEMFFQTILGSSPLASLLRDDDLHYIDWGRRGKVLLASDLPSLAAAPQIFARKLDRRVDGRLFDLIDHELLGRPGPLRGGL